MKNKIVSLLILFIAMLFTSLASATEFADEYASLTPTFTVSAALECEVNEDCDDSDACTEDACVDNYCQNTEISCDDGVVCTVDTCHSLLGCINMPFDILCDDNLYCNGAEYCDSVLDCQAATPIDCSDAYSCTDDSCNEAEDKCDNIPNDTYCGVDEVCNPINFDPPTGCGIPEDWYDGWQYRKQIKIDHTKVTEDITNFPVLIEFNDASVELHAQPDGDDILFTSDDAITKLNHEIEYYYNGNLVAWVNIPFLSSSTDTILYIYYGNDGAANQENAEAVWDSNYLAIYHLEETAGTVYDSTSNNNDGTALNGVTQDANGQIDGADQFDGSDDRIQLPQIFTTETQFTIEGWMNSEDQTGYAISQWNDHNGVFIQYYALTNDFQIYVNANHIEKKGSPNEWHYVVATFDGATVRFYLNADTPGTTTSTLEFPNLNTYLGDRSTFDRQFLGLLDEIRFSNIARSQGYIQTSYNNQKDPSLFFSLSEEEEKPVVTECENDEDCNSLDDDYCDGDLVKHDEGRCVNNECITETTTTEDCNELNNDYCDGDLVKHDEGRCVNNECITETTTTEDCNSLDNDYCDGTEIKLDDHTCDSAACVFDSTILVEDCDDGLYCNGEETCDNAACVAGTAPDCDDAVSCTDDSCNEVNDECDNIANNANCDDGLYCNGAEYCDIESDCQDGTAVDCNDQDICTKDSCDEDTDECVNNNIPNCCVTDEDCNELDKDYCAGDLIRHDEGKCLNHECAIETTLVQDCNYLNQKYCYGTKIKYEDYTCEALQCVLDTATTITDCDDSDACTGQEYCLDAQCIAGTPVDCSGNNIESVATCYYNPDEIDYTWDYRAEFISQCVEPTGECTTGDSTITHNCDFSCGAECEDDNDCAATECDQKDGCYGYDYYDYHNVSNDCMGYCNCEQNSCEAVTVYENDPRCTPCQTDDECDYLDDDRCYEDLVLHDEGVCIDFECGIITTVVQNCNNLNNDYCYETQIKHDDYTCLAAQCILHTTTIVQECDDALACNGQETCQNLVCTVGTPIDCSHKNIPAIGTCTYYPDGNELTWDSREAFTSQCIEPGICTTGDETIKHSCSITPCRAECIEDSDCKDYCEGDIRYYSGSCVDCICTYQSEVCDYGCEAGECLPGCTTNDDCPDDYCEDWGDDYCKDDKVNHNKTCHNWSCINEECVDTAYVEEELVENCNQDGWYKNGTLQWVDYEECKEIEQEWEEYKDYSCAYGGCQWEVTDTKLVNTSKIRNKTDGTPCDDGNLCTLDDVCVEVECVGTDKDCSAYNIEGVAECFYNPDDINFTYDFREAFTSECNEITGECTQGDETITHECDVDNCNADCVQDTDCPEKCTKTSHKLYEFLGCNDCQCEYGGYQCVVGKCNAECDEDSDCICQEEDYCDGTTLVVYPDYGRCGTAGSEGCICQVDNTTEGECAPTLHTCELSCGADCSIDDDCDIGEICNLDTCSCECSPQDEVCDGRDNDCDGLIDEGDTTEITIESTTDNDEEVFLDGYLLSTSPDWKTKTINSETIEPGEHLLAFELENEGGPAGFIASIRGLDGNILFNTEEDGTWLYSTDCSGNWTSLEYNDNSWAPLVKVGDYGDPPWYYNVTEWSDAKADWLWGNNSEEVICVRKKFNIITYLTEECGEDDCEGISLCIDGEYGDCSSKDQDCGVCCLCDEDGMKEEDLSQDDDCSPTYCPDSGCGLDYCSPQFTFFPDEVPNECVALEECSKYECKEECFDEDLSTAQLSFRTSNGDIIYIGDDFEFDFIDIDLSSWFSKEFFDNYLDGVTSLEVMAETEEDIRVVLNIRMELEDVIVECDEIYGELSGRGTYYKKGRGREVVDCEAEYWLDRITETVDIQGSCNGIDFRIEDINDLEFV